MGSTYATITDQSNAIRRDDTAFHDWYRFVLSFPPHLVRHYLREFDFSADSVVLDPFSGTGTTIVEGSLMGSSTIGIEANPIMQFASSTKLYRGVNTNTLRRHAEKIAAAVEDDLRTNISWKELLATDRVSDIVTLDGLRQLEPELKKLLIKNSKSLVPEHKALTLLACIKVARSEYESHLLLAFVKCLIRDFSNLRFGPEVGVSKHLKNDVDVVGPWRAQVVQMCADLDSTDISEAGDAISLLGDARDPGKSLRN